MTLSRRTLLTGAAALAAFPARAATEPPKLRIGTLKFGTLNWLLAEEGHPPLPLAEARPFIGRGARWMIERGFQAAGAPLAPSMSTASIREPPPTSRRAGR